MMNICKIVGAVPLLAALAALAACCGRQAGAVDGSPRGAAASDTAVTMTVTIDSLRVTWLKDNDGDKLMPIALFGGVPDTLVARLGLHGGVPATVSAYMVECGGRRVLFDTGNGGGAGRLADRLSSLGVAPADIDAICLTHMHGDHIGGMIDGDSAAFPRAGVYVSRSERDAWMQMDGSVQQARVLDAYGDRLHLFEWGDTLPGGIVACEAAGHTPGHTAYLMGRLMVVGDLMHGVALQMEHPEYCAGYDIDTAAAVATRRRILARAAREGLVMAGMHFPAPGLLFPGCD